jgi:hypothetical protein
VNFTFLRKKYFFIIFYNFLSKKYFL